MGVTNAVNVHADAVGELTLVGPGAGGAATASSVLSDLVDMARGRSVLPFGQPVSTLEIAERQPMQRHEGGYYIRLSALDRPGAAASIATRMAERQISLESIVQRRSPDADRTGRVRRSRAGRPDHLCDERGRDSRSARCRARGRAYL